MLRERLSEEGYELRCGGTGDTQWFDQGLDSHAVALERRQDEVALGVWTTARGARGWLALGYTSATQDRMRDC